MCPIQWLIIDCKTYIFGHLQALSTLNVPRSDGGVGPGSEKNSTGADKEEVGFMWALPTRQSSLPVCCHGGDGS